MRSGMIGNREDAQEDEESSLLMREQANGSPQQHTYASDSDDLAHKQAQGEESKEEDDLSLWHIASILSTSFSYGCIMTTLFLIILPVECQRIETQHPNQPKSVSLGIFVAIAGVTQLVSPLFGMLSDTYRPPAHLELGQRLPYLFLGVAASLVGLMGQYLESYQRLWLRYGVFFFFHMIGLNITYAMMIALIPDQVPPQQTGVANGILALLLLTGSLFGFGLFHVFTENVQDMYSLYICIVVATAALTGAYAHDKDASLTEARELRLSFSERSEDPTNEDDAARRRRRRRRLHRQVILTPWLLFRSMLYDPLRRLDSATFLATYTLDMERHYDFFIVTVSRLFYYCGMSVQTFFLYFLHDILHQPTGVAEANVANLAILGQLTGALTTYPMGLLSDRWGGGRRKPFVYVACFILALVMLCLLGTTTLTQMKVLSLVLGAANGMYLTMETSLAVDSLHGENEEGQETSHAQLLGIWGVAAFLGSALGPMINGPLLYLFGGGRSSEDGSYQLKGYAVILCLSAFYFAASAFTLRWVKGVR